MSSNKNYVAVYSDKPVAFISIGQSQYKYRYWQVSRLVVLPDYQGIGIGLKLLTWVATHLYEQTHQNIFIISSNPQLIHLRKNPRWILKRMGHAQGANNRFRREKGLTPSTSKNRLTFSFKYKPERKQNEEM